MGRRSSSSFNSPFVPLRETVVIVVAIGSVPTAVSQAELDLLPNDTAEEDPNVLSVK
jgi:hypothetical protein